jgi:PAS domain S-box-containing protein
MRCGTKEKLLNSEPIDLSPDAGGWPALRGSRGRSDSPGREERAHRFEWLARRVDGTEIPLEIIATAIQAQGRSLHVVVSRDITERKQVEAALRESGQLLSSTTDNISEAIYRTGPDHQLVFVNRAYLRMCGYDSLEEIRQVPRERLYANPADRRALLEQLARTGRFREEIEFVRKDGTRFGA